MSSGFVRSFAPDASGGFIADGGAGLDPRASRECSPVEITARVLKGRWTALVVWQLFWGEKRFYQLLRETGGINRRALAHELEQLERLGIVVRRVRHAGSAKVQYGLTALGESLKLVVGAMYEWGLLARHRLSPPDTSDVPPLPTLAAHLRISDNSPLDHGREGLSGANLGRNALEPTAFVRPRSTG